MNLGNTLDLCRESQQVKVFFNTDSDFLLGDAAMFLSYLDDHVLKDAKVVSVNADLNGVLLVGVHIGDE